MNGARFVHDQLEQAGWQVEIADAVRVKGLAPLACKTDRIDACVLAELARRDLVPAIWLPDPQVRAERGTGQLPAASRPSPHQPQAARARGSARTWQAVPRLRSLWHRRPRSARAASAARTVAGHGRGKPAADRRARQPDRRLRKRVATTRHRPPLRAAAAHRPRNRLGARLHDRSRDRRHQPLRHTDETDRIHRPLPTTPPTRTIRPTRRTRQERATLPALGTNRVDHARQPPPALPRTLPTRQTTTRQTTRRQGRPDRPRPPTRQSDWHMLTRKQPFAPAS